MQRGLRVRTDITIAAARPVAERAVRMAARTLPSLVVLVKPLGTALHTQALVEEVILLAVCTKKRLQNSDSLQLGDLHSPREQQKGKYHITLE